jgi:hypothetical protein
MDDPVAELAVFFRRRVPVPDETLIRLTIAARTAGHSWTAIAAACGVAARRDADGVITYSGYADTAPALLFLGAQHAAPACGQQVTDRMPAGRPAHIEHGHAPGCARLARDQAIDADTRRASLPQLIGQSELACGALQRHRLTRPIISDCPRCGWHGYFHDYLATINDDWAAAVCDNCYADLHPEIAVSVAFFSARLPVSRGPSIVIRRRTRSDRRYPDLGEQMAWRLCWEHTTLLSEDGRGSCVYHIAQAARADAEQLMATLASCYWPPAAAELPWVVNGYPS